MANKEASVAEMTDKFRTSNAVLLTEYRGLSVAQLKSLRQSISEHATYAVVKNTLTKIAAKDAGVEGLDGLLSGPSALAFIKGDPVEGAKGLRDFAKAHPLLVIKGGYMDGRMLSAAEIAKLADLESREVLLAKLAGAMKASLSQAAALFQAPLAQAARTIEALRVKAEADPSVIGGAGAAAPAAEAAPATEEAAPEAVDADVEAPAESEETATEAVADDAPAAEAVASDDVAEVVEDGTTTEG